MVTSRISIVTPSYNQARFVGATIESVLSQEGDFEIEYSVMDGGSTDGSVDIIRYYADLVASGRVKAAPTYVNGARIIDRPAGQMGTCAPGTVGDGMWPAGANVSGASGHGASSASGSTTCRRPLAHASA